MAIRGSQKMGKRIIVVWAVLASLCASAMAAELSVSSNFEGGSVKVLAIDHENGVIRFQPGGDPRRGWPCWWYFHVAGITPGRILTLELDMTGISIHPQWAMPQRASFSTDKKRWQQTAPGERREKKMIYRQAVNAKAAWFAWGPPFLASDAAELVRRAASRCGDARAFELCQSAEGRPVPAVRIGPREPNAPRFGLWINARQHAWEAGSSWVSSGLVEWLASDDPRAVSLRKKAEIVVVPIMDVDNVVAGQGGKNQLPHDHNRDWSDTPRFPAVAAAQREIRAMASAGHFHFYLDLHNPGWADLEPFFNSPQQSEHPGESWQRVQSFLGAARAELTGPILFKGRFGQTGPKYDPKAWQFMSEHWVRRNTGPEAISLALETPWNTPESTIQGYQAFGRQLGLAIARYIDELAGP